jgi:hypothetical protein
MGLTLHVGVHILSCCPLKEESVLMVGIVSLKGWKQSVLLAMNTVLDK